MENAVKGACHSIRVSVEHTTSLQLVIEDDGPGVPEDKLSDLGQRGLRLDEQASGSGLGLAIVRDIVQAYGCELSFSRSDLGGLKVCVQFCRASGAQQ